MIRKFFIKLKLLLLRIKKTDMYINRYERFGARVVLPEYAYINWGKYLAASGNLREAKEKFETSAMMIKQIPEAYINLGLVYANLTEYDMALKNFRKAVKLDKNNALAYSLIATVLVEKNEVDEAMLLFEKANKLDKTSSDIYFNWALGYMKQKKYIQAAEKFNMALTVNPENINASNMWGASLMECKKYDEALNKFNYTLSFVSNDYMALYYSGVCCMQAEKYSRGLEFAQKALLVRPYSLEAHLLAAELNMKLDNKKKCMQYLDQANKLGVKSVRLKILEGVANKQFRQYDNAKKIFSQVLEILPNDEFVLFNYGVCELLLNNEEAAKDIFLRLVDVNPKHSQALYNLGLYCFKTGKTDEALDYFNRVKEISVSSIPTIYSEIASCYARKRELDKAVKYYNKSLEYAPEIIEAYVKLIAVYLEMKDYVNAKRIARIAYKKDSEDIFINYLYAVSYYNDNGYREAIEKFEYVLSKKEDYMEAFWAYVDCLIELNRPKEALEVLNKKKDDKNEKYLDYFTKALTKLACIEPSYYNIQRARECISTYKENFPEKNQEKDYELELLSGLSIETGE